MRDFCAAYAAGTQNERPAPKKAGPLPHEDTAVPVIQRPGEPSGQISLGIGWYLAFLGSLMIAIGGAIRASGTERKRKPPGVL